MEALLRTLTILTLASVVTSDLVADLEGRVASLESKLESFEDDLVVNLLCEIIFLCDPA